MVVPVRPGACQTPSRCKFYLLPSISLYKMCTLCVIHRLHVQGEADMYWLT